MSLKQNLLKHIDVHGPMDIGTYMSMALGHPEFGYYMTRDPFGKDGDFTTAPEVSQMFGELIGAWVADCWMQAEMPKSFALCEFGGGRGTLMADALRVCSKVSGFIDALSLHLVETSPVLKKIQEQNLQTYNPVFHDSVDSLPDDVPLFCIGNEFLDALPVRQYEKRDGGWYERVVGTKQGGDELSFGLGSQIPDEVMPQSLRDAVNGSVYEVSPVREQFMQVLFARIKVQGGLVLLIDYGYSKDECGDSLQALKRHKRCDVLYEPGEADITAHVDFSSVERVAEEQGLVYHGTAFQKSFLLLLGIEQRAAALTQNADEKQARDIRTALDRLTGDQHMGTLFKVCAVMADQNIQPAGFA